MSNNKKLDICNKALLRAAGVENPEPQYEEPETEQPVQSFEEWRKSYFSDVHISGDDEWQIAAFEKGLRIGWNARPERESSYPLEYCTYMDKDGKRKFLTDFVPQVIAAYEMGIRKYQEGQYPGAVYNAMEDALTEYFLTRIEDGAGK